jgi:hypothetical protein
MNKWYPLDPKYGEKLEKYVARQMPATAPRSWPEATRSLHHIQAERLLRGVDRVRLPVVKGVIQ